jgi:hypothetical protein
MKKMIVAAVAAVALSSVASAAGGGCPGPFCGGQSPFAGSPLFQKKPVPAFQAAPWYLYWPYNSHFMTPAPLFGAPSYGPPAAGGMVNPYFPAAGAPIK